MECKCILHLLCLQVSFIYADRAYVVVRSGNKLMVTLKRVDERPNISHFTKNGDTDSSDGSLSDDKPPLSRRD